VGVSAIYVQHVRGALRYGMLQKRERKGRETKSKCVCKFELHGIKEFGVTLLLSHLSLLDHPSQWSTLPA